MIDFVIGVCVGYFCRPAVGFVINLVTEAWEKYQSGKSDDSSGQ